MMPLEGLFDTLLNVWQFAFVGILVWLYFKREPKDSEAESQKSVGES